MSNPNFNEFLNSIPKFYSLKDSKLIITNSENLKKNFMDQLVYYSIFSEDEEIKNSLRWIIRETALAFGAIPSSIQAFYEEKSKGKHKNVTVPAINIRGLTYDTARSIFRCALRNNSKAFIFEIAKTEIGYTKQKPSEYSSVILGAAIRENYSGPIFIQGDHFQVNAKKFAQNPSGEINELKELIKEAVEASFYNIDIDASTTVDLSKSSVNDQQFQNYESTAILTKFIRENEPKDLTVSIGGEIGEVGGKNSTVEELEAFLKGYKQSLENKMPGAKGLSKISVQTGTTHGGVVLPNGTVEKVKLDFETLRALSRSAKEFGLSGAVQHGASTLPREAFDKFPETDTAEIHLATGFQNIIYDSSNLPLSLKNRIIEYIHDNFISEKKEGETDEQFVYKTRKKAFGPFKKELYDLAPDVKEKISKELEDQFCFLFNKLNAINTSKEIDSCVKPLSLHTKPPKSLEKLLN